MKLRMEGDKVIAEGVRIEKFEQRPTCAKCGARMKSAIKIVRRMRKALGIVEAPITINYCGGGKPPSEDVRDFFFFGHYKRENICAGHGDEHLHRSCPRCGWSWLTEVKI